MPPTPPSPVLDDFQVGYVPATASGSNGTALGKSDDATAIVANALQVGYRFLDCAQFYGNEKAVGRAIRSSGIARSQLFIASKVWGDNIYEGSKAVRAQVLRSLDDLQIDYFDLYLVHWPVPGKHVAAYATLQDLRKEGKIRSIGVSNYAVEDLNELLDSSMVDVVPAVNQIEVNPFLYRKKTIDYFRKRGVAIQAYRALRQGKEFRNPVIVRLARKYNKSPAQILGRWCVQKDIIYVTKSTRKDRMVENAQIFDFELDNDDMSALEALTTRTNLQAFEALYRKCVVRDTPLEESTSLRSVLSRRVTVE